MSNTITLYGCGGTGTNIASQYLDRKKSEGLADIVPVFIDTSRSNVMDLPEDINFYLIGTKNGSGMIRAENAPEVQEHIPKILLDHAPGDFAIVVFNTSGGTGSVVGPLLLEALLKRGVPAIAVAASSELSIKASENSLKTLQSLELNSQNAGVPLVMSWHPQKSGVSEKEVDSGMVATITSLAILMSGENRRIDHMDVVNFFNWSKMTSARPRLCTLHAVGGEGSDEYLVKLKDPISMISLDKDPDGTMPNVEGLVFAKRGFADINAITKSDSINSFNYVVALGELDKFYRSLHESVSRHQQADAARVEQKSIIDGIATGGGSLIL